MGIPTEVRAFEVTCPPGVGIEAPQIVDLDLPVRIIDTIEVQVPPGPLGSMGFAIGANGTPLFPYDSDVYVVTDDATFTWQVVNQIDSGAWQALMYNNGSYPHTIYIYFTCRQPPAAQNATTAGLLPAAGLASG